MRNRIIVVVCSLAVLWSVGSCRVRVLRGEGKKGTITIAPGAFTSLDVSVPVKLIIYVKEGVTPSLAIEGYENILSHIKPVVKNGTLVIESDMHNSWILDDNDDMIVTITAPSFQQLSVSGATGTVIHGNLTGTQFKMDMSGACKVIIDSITVDTFESEASGASKIEVNGGVVKTADYSVSGAGKIMAYPLQASSVSISISGAGSGQVTALQKLSASISGAGSVKYKGHPVVTQDISGAGSVNEAN